MQPGKCAQDKEEAMKKILSLLTLIIAVWLVVVACDVTIKGNGPISLPTISSGPSTTGPPSSGTAHLGKQTKTSGCEAHGGLPDSACTPGAVFTNATPEVICVSGYTRTVRNVPFSEKDQVYAEYGISHHVPGQYEVDHLVPLELGGSNDIANLWPEAASPTPGFHEKDQVENYLHDQVCSGAMALKDAQKEIATNWLAVYKRMTNQ
jgi:hypothetical protein